MSTGDQVRSVRPAESPTKDLLDAIPFDREGGWSRLVDRCDGKLRVLVHFRAPWRPRDAHSEEDLVQEVWSEAARNFHDFEYRGPGSFQRWCAGILANKLRHATREAQRRPIPVSDPEGPGVPGTASGASGPARRREFVMRVRSVLERLPDVEREAILLKLFEGLSGREAAERLGVEESTVSVRFKRGLESCAVQLREFAP